jgi:predicted LPLAT superfamily acyltransferase
VSAAPQWTGKTRGGRFGNWWFIMLVRHVGLWPAYAWLVFVGAWFTVFARREAAASRQYLERILGRQAAWLWPVLVFRHFYSMGVTLLDRIAIINGTGKFQFDYAGEQALLQVLAENRGAILLTAHAGSWEMGGHLLARHGRPINIVVLEREEQRIREMFDAALRARQFNILTASADPLRSVPIMAALRRGEMVAMHGDRTFGSDAVTRVPFFGAPASFPVGAYLLSAATGAPVLQVFAVRVKLRRYRFVSFPALRVARERGPAQQAILRQCAEQYVANLETVLREFPFQWYNFYPFWDEQPNTNQT